jgi:hypothetical protein
MCARTYLIDHARPLGSSDARTPDCPKPDEAARGPDAVALVGGLHHLPDDAGRAEIGIDEEARIFAAVEHLLAVHVGEAGHGESRVVARGFGGRLGTRRLL